jgi:hypothetical protein
MTSTLTKNGQNDAVECDGRGGHKGLSVLWKELQ